MNPSLASGALVVFGVLIAAIGLFVAGDITVIVTGLVTILAGGLLGIAERRMAR